MPGAVNNNLTNILQTISRLGGLRNAEQFQQFSQQLRSAAPADNVDLTGLRELSPEAMQAVDTARSAQTAATEAQAAGETLDRSELQIRELRSLANQAASVDMSAEDRAALTERFNALQTEINAATGGASFQGQTLDQRLAAPTQTPAAQTPQMSVTGRGVVNGRTAQEAGVALEDSNVARGAGITDVQVADTETNAVFRFQDAGNGQVTATRYNVTENGLEEAGSQTLAVENFQNGAVTQGQTATMDFDRLGVTVNLNEAYTAGDLNNVEVAIAPAPPPEEPETPPQAPAEEAAEGDTAALAYDIGTLEGAAAAVTQIDTMLNRVAELRTNVQEAQVSAQQTTTSAFAEIGASGGPGVNMGPDLAASVEEELRVAILREAATSLLMQGGFDRQTVVGLLGDA